MKKETKKKQEEVKGKLNKMIDENREELIETVMNKREVGVTSPTHIFKLLDRIGVEMNSHFFESEARKVMKTKIEQYAPLLEQMEQRDDNFQNIPEVRVQSLKKEIKDKDEILRKNYEEERQQVQIGLYQRGYPQTSPMYDSFLEKMKLDLEEAELKVEGGIVVLNPTFNFQKDHRWVEIQMIFHKKNIIAIKENIAETEKQIKEVQADITLQNERIKSRRIQILEELKELKQDISEYVDKTPNYIG